MSATLRTFILMAGLTALLVGLGALAGGRGGAMAALAFAGAGNLWAWWNSDRAVLRQQGAQRVDRADAPALYDLTAALAGRAGLPMPALYILPTDQPNAFATGRSPDRSAVALTRGLLAQMPEDEIAGVIAHELAHIRNRDTLLMTVTATLAGAIAMLGNILMFSGGRGDNRGGALGGLVAMLLAPLAASLVQMAISRTREFAADRTAAEITGDPEALARALTRIATLAGRTVNVPAEKNPAAAALFIINPLGALRLDRLFATHPPTEARIAALRAQG